MIEGKEAVVVLHGAAPPHVDELRAPEHGPRSVERPPRDGTLHHHRHSLTPSQSMPGAVGSR
eukprot:1175276-Pyramimonas_sp.AAC.1